jgi:hypothetical protein
MRDILGHSETSSAPISTARPAWDNRRGSEGFGTFRNFSEPAPYQSPRRGCPRGHRGRTYCLLYLFRRAARLCAWNGSARRTTRAFPSKIANLKSEILDFPRHRAARFCVLVRPRCSRGAGAPRGDPIVRGAADPTRYNPHSGGRFSSTDFKHSATGASGEWWPRGALRIKSSSVCGGDSSISRRGCRWCCSSGPRRFGRVRHSWRRAGSKRSRLARHGAVEHRAVAIGLDRVKGTGTFI